MKNILMALFVLIPGKHFSQINFEIEKTKILEIIRNQEVDWNHGNLEGFMAGYWKSDSLKFIGKKGLTRGWQNTLENYKKSYSGKSEMGQLGFEIISIEFLCNESALVVGKWELKRTEDNPKGYFSLVWKKINGRWVIIADHSS